MVAPSRVEVRSGKFKPVQKMEGLTKAEAKAAKKETAARVKEEAKLAKKRASEIKAEEKKQKASEKKEAKVRKSGVQQSGVVAGCRLGGTNPMQHIVPASQPTRYNSVTPCSSGNCARLTFRA